MNPPWKHLLLAVTCSVLMSSPLLAGEIGMVTGSPTGTYIKIGQDIAGIAGKVGVSILVKESQGSIDNINRMKSTENAGLGIVQSDVLGYLSRSDSPELRAVADKLRLIFPLYNEEVHLFAKKDITRFEDLAGKRVVVGLKGSGNWLTSINLLQLMNVKPREYVEDLPPVKAVTEVLTGKADAMIFVAGKPVELFANLERLKSDSTYAPLLDQVHFVGLDNPNMLREYAPARIGSADYSWFAGEAPTIAVKALLITFDFSGKKNLYFTQRCQDLAILGKALRDNIDELRQSGHPKWKEVRLEEGMGIWKVDSCSRSGSQTAPATVKETDRNIQKELETILGKPTPRPAK